MENYYHQKIEDIFEVLNTDEKGLSSSEANKRLKKHGKNELISYQQTSKFALFFSQFKDVLTIMLLVVIEMQVSC